MINYMQFIKEMNDPLSGGTTDIKISVEGKNDILINKLIDNLSVVIKKRSMKSLRIKSITGYINKQTFTSRGYYYETYLTITLSNKDVIVGEFKSSSKSILVKINDDITYDMDHKNFDNEFLVDRMISEYVKYLKEKKFTINEGILFDTFARENEDLIEDVIESEGRNVIIKNLKTLIEIMKKEGLNINLMLNDLFNTRIVSFNGIFVDDDGELSNYQMTEQLVKRVEYQGDMGNVKRCNVFFSTKDRDGNQELEEHIVDLEEEYITIHNYHREPEKKAPAPRQPRIRWYHKGKLKED